MTFTSTSFYAPSFTTNFWRPYVPVPCNSHANEAMETSPPAGSMYSPQLHGDHADFVRSEDYARYAQEVDLRLRSLVELCQRHGVPDAEKIENNFRIFFNHRFEDPHYFDTRAEIVDSIGKQSLDEFCSMAANEAIEVGKRTAAIRDLSYGVTLCADGAISSLVSAACMLAKAVGGIRGKLWELKEETAVHVLRQLIDQRFGHAEDYVTDEVHYVNTARNLLADQFGLEKNPDGVNIPKVAGDAQFLASCAAGISAALTPDRLALLIAEDCHARLHSRLAMARLPPTGAWEPGTEKRFSEMLEEIGNELGLTSSDELGFVPYSDAPIIRESDLRTKSFFEIGENDGPDKNENEAQAYTYTMHTGAALIALDVLRAMDRLELLGAQDVPKNSGEWVDENGMRAALFVYGELAWVVRTLPGETVHDPLWNSKNADIRLVTWPDLLRGTGTGTEDGPPPPAAIRQAIPLTPPEQLAQTPAPWLQDAESLQRFLQRLDTEQAADYLTKNLPLIGTIGTGFTTPERREVLSQILRMGLGDAVRMLAAQWLPDTWACTTMIHAVLLNAAVPALHKAMLQEDPKSAMQAWYRPLRESGLLTSIAPMVVDLLNTPYSGGSIFRHALINGRSAAVEAFLSLVKDLLKDPVLQWNMRNGLPALLRAAGAHAAPGLSKAMEYGYTATVQAFYRGLEDLLADKSLAETIHPPLLWGLPDLLTGGTRNSGSGLGYAVWKGNAAVIAALHATLRNLLSDRSIAPHLQLMVGDMLSAPLPERTSALSEAMKSDERMAAIDAVHAMLKDPIIMPHIPRALPDLLNGMDMRGKTGVSNALEHGHAGIIEQYHGLLIHLLHEPAVAYHIQGMLVPLLTARNADGSTGLAHASEHGHTEAITAYRAMLEDPDIFVHIEDHVADLLDAEARADDRRDAASPDLYPDWDRNMDPDEGVAWHPDGDVLDLN